MQNASDTLRLDAAAISRLALCLADGKRAPDWIMVMPAGQVTCNDGREFVNDQPEAMVEAFNANPLDLPVDFEHGSEVLRGSGQRYDVAGYVKELQARPEGLFARIEWSKKGRAAIEDGEYKYVSPSFLYSGKTGRALRLDSVALTATPAISSLPALASRRPGSPQPHKEETAMDRKALCAKLGLDPDKVSDDAILAAIGELQSDVKTLRASAESPSLDKFVPRADYDKVAGERDEAKQALASRHAEDSKAKAEALVSKGIEDGKIAPASKEFYLTMCAKEGGLKEVETFLASAPKVMPSKPDVKDPPDTNKANLTAEQRKVAKQLGMSAEDYAEQLKADQAEDEEV